MAEESLHAAEVSPVVEQVRGKTMANLVRREICRQSGLDKTNFHHRPHRASRQAAAAFQTALQRAPRHRGGGGMSRNGKVHRIRVRAGETITLIIEGA